MYHCRAKGAEEPRRAYFGYKYRFEGRERKPEGERRGGGANSLGRKGSPAEIAGNGWQSLAEADDIPSYHPERTICQKHHKFHILLLYVRAIDWGNGFPSTEKYLSDVLQLNLSNSARVSIAPPHICVHKAQCPSESIPERPDVSQSK